MNLAFSKKALKRLVPAFGMRAVVRVIHICPLQLLTGTFTILRCIRYIYKAIMDISNCKYVFIEILAHICAAFRYAETEPTAFLPRCSRTDRYLQRPPAHLVTLHGERWRARGDVQSTACKPGSPPSFEALTTRGDVDPVVRNSSGRKACLITMVSARVRPVRILPFSLSQPGGARFAS